MNITKKGLKDKHQIVAESFKRRKRQIKRIWNKFIQKYI